jgi:hypothetical protein
MGNNPWKEDPHIIYRVLVEYSELFGNEVKEVLNTFVNNV